MYTHRIDAVLEALMACRESVPPLRDLYRPGSPRRAALEQLLETINRTHAIVFDARSPAE